MSDNSNAAVIATPLGPLGIRGDGNVITAIDYLGSRATIRRSGNPPVRWVVRELRDYFRDPGIRFQSPLELSGTDFQRRVWRALLRIPVGKTRTYGDLARQLGGSPRAVGNACRANPLPILVPCHRVVAATGLGGYAGAVSGIRLRRKRWLLQHEGALCR